MSDFQAAVEQRAASTPYVVTSVDGGFDVHLDVVDEQWHTLFTRQGLQKVFTFHVRLDSDQQTYSITDDEYNLTWTRLGDGRAAPVLAAAKSRQVGTVREFSTQKIWAWDDQAQYGKVVDYRFNSEEGRALIRAGAEAVGWKQTTGAITKVGLAAAAAGVALAVIVVVVVLIGVLGRG